MGNKSVADIIIDRILKDVEETGSMPWQRPYETFTAFNYFTKESYRGINRLLLPSGEYMTKNQINDYNKKTGEDFTFQKGIKWFPVVFFKHDQEKVSKDEIFKLLPDDADITDKINSNDNEYLFSHGSWSYLKVYENEKVGYIKTRSILRYTPVAERQHFRNSKGEYLPSRIETGEVVITQSKPNEILQGYFENSGVTVSTTTGIPCYIPGLDAIQLNKHSISEESYFSTAFHESAHSTGHKSRLNRASLYGTDKNSYAIDECIAEICACLCCAECGVHSFETSGTLEYQNNTSYMHFWKGRIKDWGKEFIYIVSQAEKAFKYIMNTADGNWEEGSI